MNFLNSLLLNNHNDLGWASRAWSPRSINSYQSQLWYTLSLMHLISSKKIVLPWNIVLKCELVPYNPRYWFRMWVAWCPEKSATNSDGYIFDAVVIKVSSWGRLSALSYVKFLKRCSTSSAADSDNFSLSSMYRSESSTRVRRWCKILPASNLLFCTCLTYSWIFRWRILQSLCLHSWVHVIWVTLHDT